MGNLQNGESLKAESSRFLAAAGTFSTLASDFYIQELEF